MPGQRHPGGLFSDRAAAKPRVPTSTNRELSAFFRCTSRLNAPLATTLQNQHRASIVARADSGVAVADVALPEASRWVLAYPRSSPHPTLQAKPATQTLP